MRNHVHWFERWIRTVLSPESTSLCASPGLHKPKASYVINYSYSISQLLRIFTLLNSRTSFALFRKNDYNRQSVQPSKTSFKSRNDSPEAIVELDYTDLLSSLPRSETSLRKHIVCSFLGHAEANKFHCTSAFEGTSHVCYKSLTHKFDRLIFEFVLMDETFRSNDAACSFNKVILLEWGDNRQLELKLRTSI